jgi:hypothetical protein
MVTHQLMLECKPAASRLLCSTETTKLTQHLQPFTQCASDESCLSHQRGAVEWRKLQVQAPMVTVSRFFNLILLLIARDSSTRVPIVVDCLLCCPGNTLCSQRPRATWWGWVGAIEIHKFKRLTKLISIWSQMPQKSSSRFSNFSIRCCIWLSGALGENNDQLIHYNFKGSSITTVMPS